MPETASTLTPYSPPLTAEADVALTSPPSFSANIPFFLAVTAPRVSIVMAEPLAEFLACTPCSPLSEVVTDPDAVTRTDPEPSLTARIPFISPMTAAASTATPVLPRASIPCSDLPVTVPLALTETDPLSSLLARIPIFSPETAAAETDTSFSPTASIPCSDVPVTDATLTETAPSPLPMALIPHVPETASVAVTVRAPSPCCTASIPAPSLLVTVAAAIATLAALLPPIAFIPAILSAITDPVDTTLTVPEPSLFA